jgi:hypothetical protein
MKLFLLLALSFGHFSVYTQERLNLVGNYFPDKVPSEMGLHLTEFNYLFQTWSYVQFPEPIILKALSTGTIQVQFNSFIIAKDDTTCHYNYEYRGRKDTLQFYKDSIQLAMVTDVCFIDNSTNEQLSHDAIRQSYYFCDDKTSQAKFMLKIENVRRNACDYSLYYSPTCEMPSNKTLIYYGKIRLRKHRKFIPRD